jgi:GTP cyclohydrolase I
MPDLGRAERAVRELLLALDLDPDDPDLAGTPARVARAWAETLVGGYREDPRAALGDGFANSGPTPVTVTVPRIPFLAVCPHHLLPLIGEAHVAFRPKDRVPGFGRLAKLIDTLAHRLVLQEELTGAIAEALESAIDAAAVVVVLEARHSCVAVTDPARQSVVFRTRADRGPAEITLLLAAELESSLKTGAPELTPAPRKKKRKKRRR